MSITRVKGPLPGPKGRALLERWRRCEADVTGFQAPVVWDRAEGCGVTDVDGNRYLDWTSGVLVANVGHCHPVLVEAVRTAATRLLNNYECAHPCRIEAAERLVGALPKHLDRCFFLSTGSEACDAAVRLIKRRSGKFEVISFEGGFHGRIQSMAAAGGLPGPKKLYGPTMPGAIRLPYPNPYRDPCGWCKGGPEFRKYFQHVDAVIMANSTGSIAGLIVEPYQGTSGFIFPPRGWLKKLEEWARKHDMLFILDEVQSSYGRTGRMWAMEHEGIRPDVVAIGKGIGSGVTVSALAGTSDVFSCLQKGEMSSTAGGNPLACAAVIAVLDIMRKERLPAHAARVGAYMKAKLRQVAKRCACIGDVRGTGLVMGVEFVKDRKTKAPAPDLIKPLILACANNGLLVGAVGTYGNVIRVAPPLVISREEIDESVALFEKSVRSLKPEP